jgi:hypothetical protein
LFIIGSFGVISTFCTEFSGDQGAVSGISGTELSNGLSVTSDISSMWVSVDRFGAGGMLGKPLSSGLFERSEISWKKLSVD